jgi:hypothetical protein
MDKHNRDNKKTKRDDKKPVNKNPQHKPEKAADVKSKSKNN